MRLAARFRDVVSGRDLALLNESDLALLGLSLGDTVRMEGSPPVFASVSSTRTLTGPGEIGLTAATMARLGVAEGDPVVVTPEYGTASSKAVRRKMDGLRLSKEEIDSVVEDVTRMRLSRIEVSAWLTALQANGMDPVETAEYTLAMSRSGGMLDFDHDQVLDFHSIGGTPGNKITPIVVSIVAAAGHTIPKLSSRSISGACGTADFVETFCRVDLCDAEVRRVAAETGGVFSWTGATDLAPAGDVFIDTQNILGIDPRPQLLASIMSKKLAAGATDLLIELPAGPGTKVPDDAAAKAYVRDLGDLGDILGINVECAVTRADQPLGSAVGPALEARECMQVLESAEGFDDVRDKACLCAGILLEMAGDRGGRAEARRILDSGEALAKFREIAAAQGGRPGVSSGDMVPGPYSADVAAPESGVVASISNEAVVAVARVAGSPRDKGAGLIVRRKAGDAVRRGEPLATVFAESAEGLAAAVGKSEAMPMFAVLPDRRGGTLRRLARVQMILL